LNLEMGLAPEIMHIAAELRPHHVCLVPEKRQELTTEGGLALDADDQRMRDAIARLQDNGTAVSLFIDPEPDTVQAAASLGARAVELHTGAWAEQWLEVQALGGAAERSQVVAELRRLESAAAAARDSGLICNAGHGITYRNVRELLHLPGLHELNIGHTIVARALLVGMRQAVADMRHLITTGPG
ncbi:MAG: pyridoxine 5'-phosphate synthase, partial [Planctomycetota bacterium]